AGLAARRVREADDRRVGRRGEAGGGSTRRLRGGEEDQRGCDARSAEQPHQAAAAAALSAFRPPEVSATISAAIASATCAGDRPPRSRPAGPWIPSKSLPEQPTSMTLPRPRSA